MIRKLTRHGNSVALVIPKAILELLGWNENEPVEIVMISTGLAIKKKPTETVPDLLGGNE